MSFFDRQGIQESILQVQDRQGSKRNGQDDFYKENSDLSSESGIGDQFNTDITVLYDYCLI
jgi:hypothetical protein